MHTSLDKEVKYFFEHQEEKIHVNEWIGKQVKMSFLNEIQCIDCNNITQKSFANGFCYSCFLNSPQNSECIINPELCEAHLGKGRDPEWEEKYHNKPHIVYISYTGDFKIGVTSEHQIPTRWIDQGAIKAVILARTPYRRLAGEIEVYCKDFIADKTNWSKMLKTHQCEDSIDAIVNKIAALIPSELREYLTTNETVANLRFPVQKGFEKYKSFNFEKQQEINTVLQGIKGQYLIFEDGQVFNIRKHAGYLTQFEITENPVLSLF